MSIAKQRVRRHPAEVTIDRLGDAMEKWPDYFDGADRDMVSHVIHILDRIAEEELPSGQRTDL